MTTIVKDGQRVALDPMAVHDELRSRIHRLLTGPGSAAEVRQMQVEVLDSLAAERAELARLTDEAASRKIRLAGDVVRQRHAESLRACERRVTVLEDLCAELDQEAPQRELAERSLVAEIAEIDQVTERLRRTGLKEYGTLASKLSRILAQLREHDERITALHERARKLGPDAPRPRALTEPVAPGTVALAPIWGDGLRSVKLPVLWSNSHAMFWPAARGSAVEQLLEPPQARSPAAIVSEEQVERPAHLDLDHPFTHHGTLADNDRLRERMEAARDDRQRPAQSTMDAEQS